LQAAAQEGIPPAIFNLGNLYAAGVGVAQSDENALACYEGAAG
jgi:TPR repeat protein